MKKLFLCVLLLCLLLPLNLMAATEAEKQAAIDAGLSWLAGQQSGDGRWQYGDDNYDAGATAAALLAFAEEGHTLTSGTAYSGVVAQGLNFLFSRAVTYPIGMQPHGDPDADGDGLGVKFVPGGNNSRDTYVTGLAIPAIIKAGTPGSPVPVGSLSGSTYKDVVQDTIDYFAFGQGDSGAGEGGWRYYANYPTSANSDNSTSQWPVLSMLYADSPGWGISRPDFVETELDKWVGYIQNPDGGSGYDHPNNIWGSNVSRTGTLLLEMGFLNDPLSDPDVQAALDYINAQWQTFANSNWNGNFGHPYAMWAAYKGLEVMVDLDDTNEITNLRDQATARFGGPAPLDASDKWTWWEDYCEYLVNTQSPGGSWAGYSSWTGPLATAWNINILAATEIPGEQQPIPEPATLLLVGSGLLGMGVFARRKKKK